MKPKVIMHSQISLDGEIDGFDPSPYYILANRFKADMILFGSDTVLTGTKECPLEKETDFFKPVFEPDDQRISWVIPDSRGRLKNLHLYRNSLYCKDVIILVSKATPESHLRYLAERQYDFIIAGEDHVDYQKAFEVLANKYNCHTIRTDSGGVLTNVLLEQGLVDEISLIISPVLVGTGIHNLFRSLSIPDKIHLKLVQSEVYDRDYLFVIYQVLNSY